MSRPLRIEFDGALYHVTSRGNEGRSIYKNDEDRRAFLDILYQVNGRYNWICHAYCLMDNHYHIVVETLSGNLSKGMRQLNGVYTQVFNKKYHRFGHIFQGRYKAILIQRESYLLQVCRYVILNPVRAKTVKSPEEWKWSSYQATVGLQDSHPCLTTDWILGQFGVRREIARRRYTEFVSDGITEEAIQTKVRGQIILGDDDFAEKFIKYGREDTIEIPREQRYIGRPSLDRLFDEKIKEKYQRNKKIIEAVEGYGYSQKEVGDYLGLHYSTISRLIKNDGMSRSKT